MSVTITGKEVSMETEEKVSWQGRTWGTTDECAFVSGLGSHSLLWLKLGRREEARQLLLRKYLDAVWRRQDWGAINRQAVIVHVKGLLRGSRRTS